MNDKKPTSSIIDGQAGPGAVSQPLVVGIGEILWDLLPDGKQMGGAPANFAYHARALGAASVIVSAVGDDRSGREILEELGRRGLERSGIAVVSGAPTGTVTVALDAGGIPHYTIHEGVAWDVIPWTAGLGDLAARADAVCFGSLAQRSPVSRATIGAFLDATRPDCLRVLDLNLRQSYFSRDIVVGLLGRATVLKLNDEELWDHPEIPRSECVRTERWKYIQYPRHPEYVELFDLAADPDEKMNLAEDPGQASVLAKLRERCGRTIKELLDDQAKFKDPATRGTALAKAAQPSWKRRDPP